MNVTSAIARRRAGSPTAISRQELKRRIPIVLGFMVLIVGETIGWTLALGDAGRVAALATTVALGAVMLALILRPQSRQHD